MLRAFPARAGSLLYLCALLPAFAQDIPLPIANLATTTTPATADPATADQNQPPADSAGQGRGRSLTKPKPGQQAIKPKDYHDSTGYGHPFARMPHFVAYDQKAIWTSPFHTSKRNAKWWVIFGAATGGLIAADKSIARNAPDNSSLRTLGSDVSYLGEPYTLLPIAAAFYVGGTAYGSDHFRETGLLSFEALADVTIMELALKGIFDRQRPYEDHGQGAFEASANSRLNSSFPSGHAIETMCLASVVTHEYPHKKWLKLLAYGYAAGVIGARLAANQHFPGDTMAGGAIGWFVGDYVYGHRHNPGVDKKSTISQKILGHVHISGSLL